MKDVQDLERNVDSDASPHEVWEACLDIIRDNVPRRSYKTWFEPLKAVAMEEDEGLRKLTVQLPSRFYYEWLEEHYFGLLRKTVTKVLGPGGRLYYDIVIEREEGPSGSPGASMQLPARPGSEMEAEVGPAIPSPNVSISRELSHAPSRQVPIANPFAIPGVQKSRVESQLNASYTFERFIEGDCNRLARSASWAISQQPGSTAFNPFLIYGGAGLGKTHLIQAIGNHVRQHHKSQSVLYVSSESFTSQFVQAIQNNRVGDFSSFYRQIDLLIVDDVQFFGGKEKTQEEFFHVFNALHQTGKQIILSADRPPKDIEGIEERLLSRFQWGLTTDVQIPDLETRIAILQRKAEDDGLPVSPDVLEFIAHNIKSNIRELEGSLIRLQAHSMLHGRDVDLAVARDILRDLIKTTRVSLGVEQIQQITCEYFGISEDLVRDRTRKREVVQARQVAMYFSRQLTKHSLKTIGLKFGGRDHSTVIHAVESVENQMETDPHFLNVIEELQHKLELHHR